MKHNLKHIVTAGILLVGFSLPVAGADLDGLYDRLRQAGPTDAKLVLREIRMEWAKSGSDTVDLVYGRGKDALERGDEGAAIEHFTAAIDHAPEFADAYHGRARAYAAVGLYGPALADLEQALLLNPHHFDALYDLGVLLEQMSQPDLAFETYALVLDLHPHYEEAQAARARLFERVKGRKL